MSGTKETVGRFVNQAMRVVKNLKAWAGSPRVRPWLLGLGFLLFVAMIYSSVQSLDGDLDSIEPLLLVVLVLAGPPLALPLNAVEYQIMARMLGHRVGFYDAVKVSVAAGLANYLPAPGGLAVRTAALKGRGSTIGSAVSANAIAGVLWLGITMVATGISLLVASELTGRGSVALAGGFAAMGGSALWARRGRSDWRDHFVGLFFTEVGLVLLNGVRVWVALIAIGQPTNIGAAVAISSALVIAATVGIFPGGLGIREAIGGAVAVAVDVPMAAAILALSVNRVTGLTGMGISAVVVGVRRKPAAGDGAADGGSDDPSGDDGTRGEPVGSGDDAATADGSPANRHTANGDTADETTADEATANGSDPVQPSRSTEARST